MIKNAITLMMAEAVDEDWRSSTQFGTHILWGNDVEEVLHRRPLDYWKLSFPSQMLPDVISWTSDQLPVGCPMPLKKKFWQFLVCCIP